MKTLVFGLLALLTLSSCQKEISFEDMRTPQQKFEDFVQYKTLQPIAYHSDSTNLWPQVAPWIKDDRVQFRPNHELYVDQSNLQYPYSEQGQYITTTYQTSMDENGVVYLTYLDYEYNPLQYKLISYTDTEIVLGITIDGENLIAVFKVV